MDTFLLLQVSHIVGDNFLDEMEIRLLLCIVINKVFMETQIIIRIVYAVAFYVLTATLLNSRIHKLSKSAVKTIVRLFRLL